GRWVRLLADFRRDQVPIAIDAKRARALVATLNRVESRAAAEVRDAILRECLVAPELLTIGEQLACRLPDGAPPGAAAFGVDAAVDAIGRAAEPYYAAVWDACSIDEKVALHQLAEEGLVNPNNADVVAGLMRTGLVRRDRGFALMNETFRRFV